MTNSFSIATGNREQQNPDVVYLSQANRYLVVWEEDRAAGYDVYGQLVSPSGTLDGSNYAIALLTGKDERYPRLVLDGLGGALAVWQRDNGGDDARPICSPVPTDAHRPGLCAFCVCAIPGLHKSALWARLGRRDDALTERTNR